MSITGMSMRPLLLALAAQVFAMQFATIAFAADADSAAPPLEWKQLSPVPNREGLGAPFAGVSRGALLIAGGANFPDAKPWEGGAKLWHDAAYVLESMGGPWKPAGKLPRPLAYGASITTPGGVACLGGSDAKRHYADCFLLKWNGRTLEFLSLPNLPKPCANFAGVLVGETIYVAGGIDTPDATTALHTFWSLDLSNDRAIWREFEPWPGRGRMLATMGGQGGAVYLFGGAALRPNENGQPERQWLTDAYRYTPGNGWKRIADLP